MDFSKNHNSLIIEINSIKYEVSLYLSVKNIRYLADYLNSGNMDYAFAIASIIKEHVISSPKEMNIKIIAKDYSAIDKFVKSLLIEDDTLRISYEKFTEETDVYYRFLLAANDIWQELNKATIDIPKINTPMIQGIRKAAMELEKVVSYKQAVIENNVSFAVSQMSHTLNKFQSQIQPIVQMTSMISETLGKITTQLDAVFSKINIPRISEERKQELRNSYESWGKYGWTIFPYAPISLFYKEPQTQKEANDNVFSYCNKKEVLKLFTLLRQSKGIKVKDLEEAIFDFENRKYKSCAMMLFSLIDAKLIRMQRKEDTKTRKKGQRASGKSAAINIKKRIAKEQEIEKKWLMYLSYVNLFACIEAMFANGDDFKVQPELANRNFINHGMLKRDVRRRDCVQLFLLYYNFLMFFEILN